jgi:perosamine synthetase
VIPRRTLTLYPGIGRDVLRYFARRDAAAADRVKRFEDAFARYLGVRYAVATASGTDAMLLLLDALGLRRGDHLLTSSYTIRPLVPTLVAKGYDVELLDVAADDCNVDAGDLRAKLRPDTRAVIVTHMFGTPARVDEIRAVLAGHPCLLIEDAAHAHGATYQGRRCGTLGDAAFFSFDQVKPLSTFGGGMAVTDRDDVAAFVRAEIERDPVPANRVAKVLAGFAEHALVNSPVFRLVTWLTRFDRVRRLLGTLYRALDRRPPTRNRRLSAVQAFIGLRQLDHLDARVAARRRIAQRLAGSLRRMTPQRVPDGCASSYYKFTVLASGDSAPIKERLYRAGIDVGIKDDINFPCHLDLGRPPEEFPGSTAVHERLVELPGYETLTPRQVERIARALAAIETE